MATIYPTRTTIRDVTNAFEVENDDRRFKVDSAGFYALYTNNERVYLLAHTEHPHHWDVLTSFPRRDLGRVAKLFEVTLDQESIVTITNTQLYQPTYEDPSFTANIELSFSDGSPPRHVNVDFPAELMQILEVDFWESIEYKTCRVLVNAEGRITEIGHPTLERWMDVH